MARERARERRAERVAEELAEEVIKEQQREAAEKAQREAEAEAERLRVAQRTLWNVFEEFCQFGASGKRRAPSSRSGTQLGEEGKQTPTPLRILSGFVNL